MRFVIRNFSLNCLPLLSLNIFKIYQALGRHIEQHPEDRDLFPNYSSTRKPFVLRGSVGPLSGNYIAQPTFMAGKHISAFNEAFATEILKGRLE